jgi:hypothetical protein
LLYKVVHGQDVVVVDVDANTQEVVARINVCVYFSSIKEKKERKKEIGGKENNETKRDDDEESKGSAHYRSAP